MQPRAEPVIQWRRVNRDRRKRCDIELADASQRLRQDPLLRLELFVEPQRGPVAAPAFVRNGTRRGAAPRRRFHDAHQVSFRESLLYIDETDDGDVVGKYIRCENREAIDARDRIAAGDELGGSNRDFVAGVHAAHSVIKRAPP